MEPPAPGDPVKLPVAENCVGCGRLLRPEAAFCTSCGRGRGSRAKPADTTTDRRRRFERAWRDIRFVLVLYLALLSTSGLMLIHSKLSGRVFVPMATALGIDSVIILFVAARRRRDLKAILDSPGFGPAGYLGILVAAPVVLFAVLAYVRGINALFGLVPDSFLDSFEGRGLWPAFLLGALWPAVFEELAFRGVIFGTLRRQVSLPEAFLISSFAFAILHLSVPSLVTHLPLGLWFCFLRQRSGSLWPAAAAHFLHNAGVILMETWGSA